MKRITFNFAPRFSFPYLILSLLLTVSFSLSAQVYSGNIYLNSQADVDAFSYTEVTGFLAIIGTDINHLDGLSSLASIGGDLIINENPSLTNINGLSALTSVGKTLEIVGNASLLNIDGLSSLVSVGAELPAIYGANFALLIISNPLLTDLDGLSSLSALNEISRMWVVNNSALTGFCGLYTALNSGISTIEFEFELIIAGNLANPTQQQITADGACIVDPVQMIDGLLANGSLNKGQANVLNSKLNDCKLNVLNNLTNAWTNAGFLSQGQADVLNASAADYCSTASRIAHNQIFTLGQNYPNPTGTNTVIPFTLSASGKVSIQLYDTSGKMIRNLMNQYLHEGAHEVKVNLQSVPAGTYYYKFQVGEYSETLPMVVE